MGARSTGFSSPLTMCAGLGCAGCLFSLATLPAALASFSSLSFSLTRVRKS
ncbi:unnamed protein product [Plutella xylostella]|uniref:(diamondback moth) hypothetical protein n=1 Tax=Plutella xylostella TaxID=51655 RepID=A0A8S4D3F4_PLUXY|nr:unnamed protein product [Plutella xylostella]